MALRIEKILVCGDVEGNFDQLFKRVLNVNKKNGPFSMLLCVGEFFGSNNEEWELYKSGIKKVPLTTYLLGPCSIDSKKYFTDEKGCELAENVIYLGPCGIYPCSSGLRIAYLSGRKLSSKGVSYDKDTIQCLECAAGRKPEIDILITSNWPQGICNFTLTPNNYNSTSSECALVSRLAFKLKPRYHFAASTGIYYERLPYRNHQVLKESAKSVTRFIGLAKVGNIDKDKWLYAFNVVPMKHLEHAEIVKQPDDVTEFPFPTDILKDQDIKKMEGPQFFYDMSAPSEDGGNKRKSEANGRDGSTKRKPQKQTGPCWFCLSSPEVEKHLVVSVGTFSYLAMAKGGLTKTHLLIMPIEHFQSTPDLETECVEEIIRFKRALEKMFSSIGRSVVFFERNYRSQHLQIQVVPVPEKIALKNTFLQMSEEADISLDEIPKHSELSQLAPPGVPFFYVELPSGERLFHRIKKAFPIQFGREVLASSAILNIPDKVDWRECKLPHDEETVIRDRVRSAFKPFDFTLDEDDDDESD